MSLAHFWTLRDCAGVDDWDPDAEPDLHRSGYGHSFLELYVRLRSDGHGVSIGKDIPAGSDAVVVCLEELSEWNRHGKPQNTLALTRRLLTRDMPVVLIRNDVHPHIRSPYFTSLEMLPTLASVKDPRRQRALPLLAQRGLRPRSASRASQIRTVGLKAYAVNVPNWLPELERLLSEHGVAVRRDTDDGKGHAWADFADLDSVLCTQTSMTLGDPRRKPATKLINAWAAGVIPICEPHVAYIEMARPGLDSIFAATPEAIVSSIVSLNNDLMQAEALFAASRRRGADFSTREVLDQWVDALTGLQPMGRRYVLIELAACLAQMCLGPRVSGRLFAGVGR